MPCARYQVVDERLEDKQLPGQIFAQSNDVEELLNELPALRAKYSNGSLIVVDTRLGADGRSKARKGK
jgi:hypothetical protein